MDAATLAPPPRRASPTHGPWYTILYIQVLIAIAIGILLGHFFPKIGDPDEAARRRLHRADQDDDRAGDLLHRGARHRVDERSQKDRPRRPQDARLFRGGLDACAGDRDHRRRGAAARRRLQHRSRDARPQAVAGYTARAKEDCARRPSPRDHSAGLLFRRTRQRRPFAGSADLDFYRLRRVADGTARREDFRGHRHRRQDVLRHHPHHRQRRADRRVRRHGVHHRRLRHRLARQSRRS